MAEKDTNLDFSAELVPRLEILKSSMAEKDLNIPNELAPQLETLKNLLLEIPDKNLISDDTLVKIEADLHADGKKPKPSVVKSQLAMYKKELNETKEEIERVKQALNIIIEVREACFATIASAKKDITMETQKENMPEILKETAETLPLWINDDDDTVPPLCGAVQVDSDYVAKVGDMVAAFVKVKGKKLKEWILAEVRDYNHDMDEYEVQDIDENQTSVYILKRDKVIPLPARRANPVDNPDAVFVKGTTILALYENTTCFYKGKVEEPPSDPHQPYQIAFEDTDCTSGYSPPTSVPQRYVIVYRDFDNP